jgi:hypothetical protein
MISHRGSEPSGLFDFWITAVAVHAAGPTGYHWRLDIIRLGTPPASLAELWGPRRHGSSRHHCLSCDTGSARAGFAPTRWQGNFIASTRVESLKPLPFPSCRRTIRH